MIRFQAVDKKGLKSTAVVAGFFVDRMNGPPVLSNITAPDTLSRSEAQPFLISVQVADPQSLADIRSVYFNTTKPDGTPSAGNPFFMYDDGSRGDITIGDGIYSLTITISEQNETGNYLFAFYAEDYSAAIGGPVIHTITVIE